MITLLRSEPPRHDLSAIEFSIVPFSFHADPMLCHSTDPCRYHCIEGDFAVSNFPTVWTGNPIWFVRLCEWLSHTISYQRNHHRRWRSFLIIAELRWISRMHSFLRCSHPAAIPTYSTMVKRKDGRSNRIPTQHLSFMVSHLLLSSEYVSRHQSKSEFRRW